MYKEVQKPSAGRPSGPIRKRVDSSKEDQSRDVNLNTDIELGFSLDEDFHDRFSSDEDFDDRFSSDEDQSRDVNLNTCPRPQPQPPPRPPSGGPSGPIKRDTCVVPFSSLPCGPITRDHGMTRGMWRYPTSLNHCCIYRVPHRLRDVNPKAYTPQLLLIGPLNLSLKDSAYEFEKDGRRTKVRGYENMEHHKKIYLEAFRQRVEDENVINEFKSVIKEDEEMIRGSYSESTTWIQSQDFVEMILHDSVFILEFILRSFENNIGEDGKKIGDVLMDEPMVKNTVHEDLILLENQLPYSILKKLFDPIVLKLRPHKTLRNLIIEYFRFEDYKIKDETEFEHFTDLFRRVRVETLNLKEEVAKREVKRPIESMYNVEKLDDAGVKFEAIDKKLESLEVRFEKGCLKLPCFHVHDSIEMILRNIMALEQCLYPHEAYVCSFVIFLDHLIDTPKDVDLLVGKGIINNWMGYHGYVAEMVNKLSLGVVDFGSIYYNIAVQANAYYDNPINKSRAILKRVYFSNLWTGTATVAAVLLLLMTLIQTVASVMQVLQK